MHNILVVGAGKVGSLIALLLASAGYNVLQVDKHTGANKSVISLDITDPAVVKKFMQQQSIDAIISCLPYFLTAQVAEIAAKHQLNYFDLTEDIQAGKRIKALAAKAKTAFVPHCGLAPGWVGLLAYDLLTQFDNIDSVKLRVGGLPQFAHNVLHYVITWSIDGLINQYGNDCQMIERSKIIPAKPLEDREELEIDGMLYEAFNTSGGLGNLVELCEGKVNHLSYKTIRYPGHCEKMHFLMNELKLNDDRPTLKRILENALPESDQDVVILDVSVQGKCDNHLKEQNIVKKYYPCDIAGKTYSALQTITAAAACAVIDVISKQPKKYQGLVYQETIPLTEIKKSKFVQYLL
jgi:saccharopine dehydrogenase-like NADP-dependent oxidoreductase